MAEKTEFYKKRIEEVLKGEKRYNGGLEFQIISLAGSLRTLALANSEIDELEETTVSAISRYGNETIIPHPVFKIQKDAMASVTQQMKSLGLTAEALGLLVETVSDDDPLISLTKEVMKAGKKTIKPRKDGRRREGKAKK